MTRLVSSKMKKEKIKDETEKTWALKIMNFTCTLW